MHFKKGDPEEFSRQIDIVAQVLVDYFRKGKKRFVAGDNLTFADFCVFELLDFMNFYFLALKVATKGRSLLLSN